ncbi:MAG: hypothetical protein V3V15_06960 [Sphingorhabdus sp.]
MNATPKKIISPELPAALTGFAPVPRKGDSSKGWSPARQKAFIAALAETGSVRRAAREVNMSRVSAYYLRRHPQGAEFKRAWEMALKLAMNYLKDIAFERAVEGELEPVWQRGKLVGYRRKFNDRLLMFMIRHYGDGGGRRVTVNYVKSKAVSGSASGGARGDDGKGVAAAESSVVTIRSSGGGAALTDGKTDAAAAQMGEFSGVELDAQAEAEMAKILEECAARREQFGGTTADVNEPFVRLADSDPLWQGNFEPEGEWIYDVKDAG